MLYPSVQFSRLLEPKIVSVQRFKRLSQNNVSIFLYVYNPGQSNSLSARYIQQIGFSG